MANVDDALVIGLTGSFGSGCSTLAEALEKHHGFQRFFLSRPIREIWAKEQGGEDRPAMRVELQDIGNRLRAEKGGEALVREEVGRLEKELAGERAVIDGFKNEAEVAFLRGRFRNFFLISVQAKQDDRWNRVRRQYDQLNLPYEDFERDDIRDQIEDLDHGQQVQLCVDDSDIAINNSEFRQSHSSAARALALTIGPYIGLLTGSELRGPGRDEIMMTIAYGQSKASMCLKRHVGAVIADANGKVVATGYNENPASMKPCYLEFGYCHKDAEMTGRLEQLVNSMCPKCGERIEETVPGHRCRKCGLSLTAQYFPDRGMRWCTALHAEERALANAGGEDLRDAVLYSTTFPCSNCAREIADRGIRKIVYVEPYPDKEALWYFNQNKIEVVPFEGVKARAFERLFRPFRRELERKYAIEPAKRTEEAGA